MLGNGSGAAWRCRVKQKPPANVRRGGEDKLNYTANAGPAANSAVLIGPGDVEPHGQAEARRCVD